MYKQSRHGGKSIALVVAYRKATCITVKLRTISSSAKLTKTAAAGNILAPKDFPGL